MYKKHFLLLFGFLFLINIISVTAQTERGAESQQILFGGSRAAQVPIYNPLTTSTIFIAILAITTTAWFLKYKKNKIFGLIIVVGWIVFVGSLFTIPYVSGGRPEIVEDWQTAYRESIIEAGISSEYLLETTYFDFTNPTLSNKIKEILSKTNSLEGATLEILDEVYITVDYNKYEADGVCLETTASIVYESGTGQCDTQSMVVIAMLRGMGVAARPVGGCLTRKPVCDLKQALMQAIGKEVREPKFLEIGIIPANATSVGRKGGLHAWAEYWNPRKGWVALEPTAGGYADTGCFEYLVELYPTNEDKERMCVSTDLDFVQMCAAR